MEEMHAITPCEIEALLIDLRGQKVMLDRDVAYVYGVETRRVNEAVKNNTEKFPEKYCFRLQPSEKQYVVENFDHLGSILLKGRKNEMLFLLCCTDAWDGCQCTAGAPVGDVSQ